MKRRVGVTELDFMMPLGTGHQNTCKAICDGRSGLRRIQKFDPFAFKIRRVARILAEVVSYGTASDAHNFTSPSSDGAVRCLKKILNDKRTNLSFAFRRFND
jgi:3-oxoacyl-(acyl-carrier-protein) synthase